MYMYVCVEVVHLDGQYKLKGIGVKQRKEINAFPLVGLE